jgi:hypothetical protein
MDEQLSPEDTFRLQVLLAQDLKAVRLDEGSMTLHALTAQGEANIPLAPNCRADRYLRLVREQLSGHALGSPGGYPVHLSRWTRHGQMDGLNLGKLLLTGEPEAVVAVVHSPALTDEMAGYAWWTQPTIENARLMLRREAVAQGQMGKVLAEFLVEHLPFLQDDHLGIMDTVAVLIYSQALTPASLEATWKKGARSNTHYVAFLEMLAGKLPVALPEHPDYDATRTALAGADHPLLMALSSQGQTFLSAVAEILERPETQEVVSRTLNAMGHYLRSAGATVSVDGGGAEGDAEKSAEKSAELAPRLQAAMRLSQASDAELSDIFTRSTAIGSLMRRKIEPIITPVLHDIKVLLPANKTGARRRPMRTTH